MQLPRFASGLVLFFGLQLSVAARSAPSTFVDDQGVLRWTATKAEVTQFGVNYTTPFAHAFRALKRQGIPWQKAIDADVYHFARLGFDAYRVHMWDREISDPSGNLVVNEHMVAFDYLLAKLKERGIKIILTPLQFGDAAYPEGGVPLDGFSSKYGKKGCLEDKTSWPLQERYLAQLMEHVNPNTGVTYKNDPDILAFEVCNEPGHSDYALTVDYINSMVKAIRDAGCEKPIFYNMSHGLPVFQAYLDANVQGGTFQWYPSNLVAGHEQWGNFLPYVDNYPIPFAANPQFKRKAKMFYEFDSADIGRTYIYPAMARSFRKVGAQFATQFAYDGMYVAPANTEYQTHYLNLAYAPQKALSMKIAGEAFHRIPLYKDYGAYPADNNFANVRVSYREDLAELVTDEKYFYTNRTTTPPPAPDRLAHIAGYGNSPAIGYPGQGAYFLDRLDAGVWRLEVMPDTVWVHDPFEKPNPHKQVSVIAWNEWPMRIDLPDLDSGFHAVGLNDGNNFNRDADGRTLPVRPGTYLLTRRGVSTRWNRDSKWENIVLKEFVAPPASVDKTYVLHQPTVEASAGKNLQLTATIVSPDPVERVEVFAYPPATTGDDEERSQPGPNAQPGRGNTPGPGAVDDHGVRIFAMTRVSGFHYAAEIPGEQLRAGTLRYHIVVQGATGPRTFPSALPGLPTDWDFYGEAWSTRIVPTAAPILLFDAAVDTPKITADHRDVLPNVVPSDRPGTSAMEYVTHELTEKAPDYSFRFFFKNKIHGRTLQLPNTSELVMYGRSATTQALPVQLALVTSDGLAYGGIVMVKPIDDTYAIPFTSLHQLRSPNIPHGYPVFIPFWSEVGPPVPLDLNKVESVLVSIGPGMATADYPGTHGLNIERIWLK
jgi:hypothetical protein